MKNFEGRQNDFHMPHPTGQLELQGKHERLRLHRAFGYNRNKQNAVKEIISAKFLNWNAAQPCFERLKSHLIECCCGLSLSKQHSVSDSLGFESIHGQRGGKKFDV